LIIDAHCHIWEKRLLPKVFLEPFRQLAKALGCDPQLLLDGSAERLIREMDEANIDKSVLLAWDTTLTFPGGVYFKDYNDYVAKILRENPRRFIGFCGIDPRRGMEAIQELERCAGDLGFQGVKLFPLTGFYPDDPAFYPFYERVEDLGVSILCHTGRSWHTTYLKYSQPVYLDKIAVDFPHISFIMAHLGYPWIQEAISVAAKNPNVYADLSALQSYFMRAPGVMFRILAEAKQMFGSLPRKILFGSDWPCFTSLYSQREWVERVKTMELPRHLKEMGLSSFTDKEKKMILGGNAKKIFNL
jgi:predicted TIM-barrel fold metal-dependent hydrolase